MKFKYKIRLWSYGLIFLSIIVLDQLTKFWSTKKFLLYQSPSHIHNFIANNLFVFHIGTKNWLHCNFTYVRNTGAAWGLLGNLPETIRPYFFYIVTGLAIIFILYLFLKTKRHLFIKRLAICFILAGAVGNYIDRIRLNYVVDWIHVSWNILNWQYDYPVFNIADCAVTTGVILLILESFL